MQLSCTAAQFSSLQKELAANPEVALQPTLADPMAGTVTNKDVEFSYIFNGTDTLTLAIAKRRSWEAHLASDAEIFAMVIPLFNKAIAGA